MKRFTSGRRKGQVMDTHTMFPAHWDEARIRREVTHAWERRTVKDNQWQGRTESGVLVKGYVGPQRTAYPVYGE